MDNYDAAGNQFYNDEGEDEDEDYEEGGDEEEEDEDSDEDFGGYVPTAIGRAGGASS